MNKKDFAILEEKLKEAEEAIKFYESAMDSCEGEELADGDPIHTVLDCYSVYHEARDKAQEWLEKWGSDETNKKTT